MDGGTNLNVLYVETLDRMGISHSALHPSTKPIQGVTLGRGIHPLGRIILPITFGDSSNFRTEQLQFEVMDFHGLQRHFGETILRKVQSRSQLHLP